MRPKNINFKKLLKFTKHYMHRRGQALIKNLCPSKTKRGRPKKYPDEVILTLLFLQVTWRLSFRDLELFAVQLLGRENVPDFSTYYYRLQKLPPDLLVDFLNFLARKLLSKHHKQIKFLVIDGTGFKYDELYPLKILRGLDIKKVKSHVKVVALSVHLRNGKRFVLTVASEGSYASEVKVGERIICWFSERGFIKRALEGKPLLGDKAYDSVRFMELVEGAGLLAYIKVKETFRKGIKSEVRRRAKERVEAGGVYRYRRLIESIFGEVKQSVGSYERTKSFHLARLFAVAKFCLFNLCILYFCWLYLFWMFSRKSSHPRIFQTASLMSVKFESEEVVE